MYYGQIYLLHQNFGLLNVSMLFFSFFVSYQVNFIHKWRRYKAKCWFVKKALLMSDACSCTLSPQGGTSSRCDEWNSNQSREFFLEITLSDVVHLRMTSAFFTNTIYRPAMDQLQPPFTVLRLDHKLSSLKELFFNELIKCVTLPPLWMHQL